MYSFQNLHKNRINTYEKVQLVGIFMQFFMFHCNMSCCLWAIKRSGSLRAGRSGDRIPVEKTSPATVQTVPGTHPASSKIDTGSLPRVKRPERGVDQPNLPRLKKEHSYTSTLLLCLNGRLQGDETRPVTLTVYSLPVT